MSEMGQRVMIYAQACESILQDLPRDEAMTVLSVLVGLALARDDIKHVDIAEAVKIHASQILRCAEGFRKAKGARA